MGKETQFSRPEVEPVVDKTPLPAGPISKKSFRTIRQPQLSLTY